MASLSRASLATGWANRGPIGKGRCNSGPRVPPQPVEATDDAFWDQFWADTATSVQDVFALVPAAEIRAVREESPSNLATLCYKVRGSPVSGRLTLAQLCGPKRRAPRTSRPPRCGQSSGFTHFSEFWGSGHGSCRLRLPQGQLGLSTCHMSAPLAHSPSAVGTAGVTMLHVRKLRLRQVVT